MQSRRKMLALRGMGGLIAAMAVVPWLGAGAAQASGQNDGSCATRPSGVSAGATCTLLTGPNGATVFGETWAVRTAANQLKVKTFPKNPPDGTAGVSLCVSTTAYPAKHQCNQGDPDAVYTGSGTSITVALSNFSITPSDPVFYSLSVLQASTTAVSNGSGGTISSQSPSASPTKTSKSPSASPTKTSKSPSASPTKTSPTASPTKTSKSPSASPTKTSTTPSPSVSATKTSKSPSPSVSVSATKTHRDSASPSTSVLAVKLARTGADGTGNALVLSIGMLGLGGVLVAAGQSNRPKRRH
jgi:hypothetical protein